MPYLICPAREGDAKAKKLRKVGGRFSPQMGEEEDANLTRYMLQSRRTPYKLAGNASKSEFSASSHGARVSRWGDWRESEQPERYP